MGVELSNVHLIGHMRVLCLNPGESLPHLREGHGQLQEWVLIPVEVWTKRIEEKKMTRKMMTERRMMTTMQERTMMIMSVKSVRNSTLMIMRSLGPI